MPDPNQLSIGLSLFKDSMGTLNTLWNFFSVVALAVIGLMWGGKAEIPGRGKLVLAASFLLFAIANHLAIARTQRVMLAAVSVVRTNAAVAAGPEVSPFQRLLMQLEASPVSVVEIFHGVLVVGVLGAVYLAHRRDRKA